jgi:hypothetical protein
LAEPSEPIPLRILERDTALRPEQIPADLREFLKKLDAPTVITVTGRDAARTRVVSTLLHGNEPSGLHAIHHWLRSGDVPAVNVLFFIAAVRTALEPPGFAHRFLTGRVDLNRCWTRPGMGRAERFAAEVLQILRKARPESLIDIHNNTGHSPPYGVGPATGPAELQLAALFSDRFVRNDLDLGTLVEATRDDFPSISIECGRAGDELANENAQVGLERYLAVDRVEEHPLTKRPMAVYADPVRVEIRNGIELAFGDTRIAGADFTIARDIDRHNFELLSAGSPIGWLAPNVDRPLVAVGRAHEDISDEFFSARDGVLATRRPIIPIMMTTNRRSALDDCLFYAVRRDEEQG